MAFTGASRIFLGHLDWYHQSSLPGVLFLYTILLCSFRLLYRHYSESFKLRLHSDLRHQIMHTYKSLTRPCKFAVVVSCVRQSKHMWASAALVWQPAYSFHYTNLLWCQNYSDQSEVCVSVCVCSCACVCIYSVSQEERSVFWEVIVLVILSKKYIYIHVLYFECFSR
jgi:hypothetical protein